MDAEPDYKPFEKVLEDDRTILRLHDTEEQRVKVEADKVHLIMDAIVEGWDIDVKYADIDGEINIDREINKGKIIDPNFTIKGQITIENCDIKGRVILKRCTFSQEANFSWTHFEKRVDFERAVFKARANFYGATFQDAYFRYTRFKKEALFHEATFAKANFEESQFGTELSTESSMDADFIRARFTGDMNFIRARFRQKAAFINVFFEVADFRETIFEAEAEFRGSKFKQAAQFWKAKLKYPASFNEVEFQENTVFRGLWNDVMSPMCGWMIRRLPPWCLVFWISERMMRKFLFYIGIKPQHNTDDLILDELKREIKNREFKDKGISVPTSVSTQKRDSKWSIDMNNRKKYVVIRRKNRVNVYQEKEDVSTDFFQLIEFTCSIWKKVREYQMRVTKFSRFNTTTVMDSSTNPRLKRYIDDELWIQSWRYSSKLRRGLFYIWEVMCHCGRSIGLWAGWSAFFAGLFAFIYWKLGNSIVFNVDRLSSVQPGLREYSYYSIVTFTTLGFGDIIPKTNWARFAVGAEVVLGYVMLGGLISIFANKLARRS